MSEAHHVVMGDNSVRCLNCGREYEMGLPCPINIMVAIFGAWNTEHADCEPSPSGKARYDYSDAWGWFNSWDTGISGKTLFSAFMRSGAPPRPDVPHDPADFGRCYRLLKVAPGSWREDLQPVADRYPEWQPFVDAWDELESLYEEESPSDKAPKLFARMQELVECGRDIQGR